jgi:transcription initiation factor TFIID subunit 5
MDAFKQDHLEQHGNEINRLVGVLNPDMLNDNEVAKEMLQGKYVVKMSRYSFELLLSFLQDNKFIHLLRIMNERVEIQGISLYCFLISSDYRQAFLGR